MDTKKLFSGIKCTGCAACADSCSANAITMRFDSEGFIVPLIDNKKCMDCGKCMSKCPARNDESFNFPIEGYVAYCKNDNIYYASTSGGIFGQLANVLVNEGWHIVGANLDPEQLQIKHVIISNIKEIEKIQGSKYVQSNCVGVYKQIKELLKTGEKVLFSGTPCQIAGLYAVLGNRFEEQLITIEIVCHGVSSPIFFKRNMEQQYITKAKIKQISFRTKDTYERTGYNLKIEYDNNKYLLVPAYKDIYYYSYLHGISFQESCYSCRYATPERNADITIGDCNSYKEYTLSNPEKVISIVLINTNVGKKLWNDYKGLFEVKIANIEKEVSSNAQLNHPVERPTIRDEILKNIYQIDIYDLKKKYLKPSMKSIVAYKIKRTIPLQTRINIRNFIKRILHGKN